ncbi:unnamed protein product [Lymnaea stagnalis]|uniref:Tetratricopeptide repeat protein 19, mitochondrial n=1 Tax=Lymnaea stagnalis TaxID=6523 RepID=A0AAV2I0P6_LYMST
MLKKYNSCSLFEKMATSIARKLCSSSVNVGQQLKLNCFKLCIRREQHNLTPARFFTTPAIKYRTGTKSRAALLVSGTLSFALLGINFGKKDEEAVDPLTQKYRDARLAHMRQDLKEADNLYHECLKLASHLVEAKDITEEKFLTARILMYDGLADIAMQTGQIETAEALYKDTMKGCLQQGMDINHNTIVEISLKLASIYAIIGKKQEAEAGYLFCIQTQTPKLKTKMKQAKDAGIRPDLDEQEKDTAALLGMALGSYGRFLLYEKRYTEALPMFKQACAYADYILGPKSNQYIVVLNDLATLYIVTNRLSEAEQLLEEGIMLSNNFDLAEGAALYCNLGAVHLRKGKIPEATKTCQLALEFAKKFDHKMAYQMAESCLKKCESLKSGKPTEE